MRSLRLSATLFALLSLSIAAQQSSVHFDATQVATNPFQRFTQLLDLDGNAAVDAAGWWWTNSLKTSVVVSAFRNFGGRFDLAWQASTATVAANPVVHDAVGDFNGDGREDFAVSTGSLFTVFFAGPVVNGAPGAPSSTSFTGTSAVVADLVAADFNGDGLDDIAYCDNAKATIRLSAGLSFALPNDFNLGSSVTGAELTVGDVDGDGDPDLILTTGTSTVFLVQSLGIIQSTVAYSAVSPNHMATFGDIDQDGDDDLTIFDATTYIVMRRTSATTFVQESPRTGGPAYALADVDQDGDLDGVCCSSGGGGGTPTPSSVINNAPSTFHISINDGLGNFAPAFTLRGLGSSHIAGARDIDGDGDTDLVAGRCVYYGRGPITPPQMVGTGFTPTTDYVPLDLDLDGDRDVDFGVAQFRSSNSDGTYVFRATVIPSPPPGKTWTEPAFVGDFDGDGDADMVVRTKTPSGSISTARFLRHIAGGVFVDDGNATGSGTSFMAAGATPLNYHNLITDIDADGDVDIVTCARDMVAPILVPGTKVWLNDGAGFFTPGTTSLVDVIPAAVADFNGDGFVDIVGTTGSKIPVAYFGTGGGAFQPAQAGWVVPLNGSSFYTANPKSSFVVVDYQNDQDPDFIVATTVSVYLLQNVGTGFSLIAVTSGTTNGTLATTRTLEVHDLNDDGQFDIIVNDATTTAGADAMTTVMIDPITHQIGAPIIQLATFDFLDDADRDGDLDAVGSSIVRGTKFSAINSGSMRQYGQGYPGSGGITPTLSEMRPLRGGSLCEFKLTAGLGGSVAWVGYGLDLAATPLTGFPGVVLAVDPILGVFSQPLTGAPGAPGEGTFTMPYTPPVGIGGFEILVQAAVIDPGSPYGFSMTQGLKKVYGN